MSRVALAALAAIGLLAGMEGALAQGTPAGSTAATPQRPAPTEAVPPAASGRYDPSGYRRAPSRPANCGQFRYWNGTRCADARDEPPYVGPRW